MLAATTTRRVSRHIVLVRACAIVQRKHIHHAFMSYELHISAYDGGGGGALTYLTGRVRRAARSSPPNLNALAFSKALRLHTHKHTCTQDTHTHITFYTRGNSQRFCCVCFFICICAFGCGTNRGFIQSAHVLWFYEQHFYTLFYVYEIYARYYVFVDMLWLTVIVAGNHCMRMFGV